MGNDSGKLIRRLESSNNGTTSASSCAKVTLDEKAFRFALNENAMATEKLADGIRRFAADQRELHTLIAKAN